MDAVIPREQVIGQDAANARLDVAIEGMTCASCVSRVERTIRKVPGVSDVAVNLGTEHARIAFRGKPDAAALAGAVKEAGYAVPETYSSGEWRLASLNRPADPNGACTSAVKDWNGNDGGGDHHRS